MSMPHTLLVVKYFMLRSDYAEIAPNSVPDCFLLDRIFHSFPMVIN
jgi:hypothetical protein